MTRTERTSRLQRLRAPLLALGIALSSFAAAQSAPEAPVNPDLGPAFATKTAAYVPVLFDEIPGWGDESFEETYASFSTNCKAMKRRSAWAPLCARLAKLPRNDEALRQFMHDEFYAYQMLTSTRSATGKLTGYFEPLIAGSLQQQGAYKFPIYGIPKDMYMVDSRTVAGQSSRWLKIADGRLVGAEAGAPGARQYTIDLVGTSPNNRDKRYRVRVVGNTIKPYPTRQVIDANGIDAPVLAWVADPFKLYSMQIQGSGKIQLKDGGLIRLAYAEQNGHPFMPNATRGDSDAILLAIKARALQQPLVADTTSDIEIPGGTRGTKKKATGGDAVDDEVARIVAALQGGGSASASSGSRPVAKAKAKPKPRPKSKRPAVPVDQDADTNVAIEVQSSEVEAMIQALLTAPVADESYVAPEEDVALATAADARPTSSGTSSGKGSSANGPKMDMSEFEGKGGGKAAGQAVGSGVAVPRTGIPDPSYVFFRRIGDGPEGPIGALGVPLSAGRSMAVDPRATPLGAPVFIDGMQPGNKGPMRRLVFAQDTGGAIRGSVRGDFFWGFGDKAGKMALATNQPVRMWLLLPKSVAGSAAASGIKTRSAGGTEILRDCAVPDDEFCAEDDGTVLDELLPGQ
ncbi:MltA domain-containing protein [Thermomonas sp.]|jgi:membrane-bound lytic murein transglycosylase A|uniref:MltA domain-containing protein n=1 Tax=Thermomonas sp. TaxID=1971895 RepID=UPI0035B204A9